MSALKEELMNYINDIPDDKLLAIKPLLFLLSTETSTIEKIPFESLTEDEKASIIQVEQEFIHGETVKHKDINWS